MGVATKAAINLARHIVEKYSLEIPIDVKSLVESRADLAFKCIPLQGVDGISLNLKTPGKKTKVIVNADNPPLRQRFTLAHELGHIVIPWHLGSIVDHLDSNHTHEIDDYWETEGEANSFAGELLVPTDWVLKKLSKRDDLAKVHWLISKKCQVSLHVAAIRLTQLLPKNFVYVVERHGTVEFSGKTDGTLAGTLEWETFFESDAYNYSEKHFSIDAGDHRIHWWKLPGTFLHSKPDVRDWREILSDILNDLEIPRAKIPKLKSSINGVVAFANSAAKRSEDYSISTIAAACLQRFNDRDEYKEFSQHIDFATFVMKKAQALFESNR